MICRLLLLLLLLVSWLLLLWWFRLPLLLVLLLLALLLLSERCPGVWSIWVEAGGRARLPGGRGNPGAARCRGGLVVQLGDLRGERQTARVGRSNTPIRTNAAYRPEGNGMTAAASAPSH